MEKINREDFEEAFKDARAELGYGYNDDFYHYEQERSLTDTEIILLYQKIIQKIVKEEE